MKPYNAITGTIVLRTALHVGTGQNDDATDAICRRNSEGKWIIPGTSLAGVIRALATRMAPRLVKDTVDEKSICISLRSDQTQIRTCKCITCENMGFRFLGGQSQNGQSKQDHPWASRIWIFDAVATDQTHTRIRDGVGINRSTGAAERQGATKFDLEVVPAGTRFSFRVELEDCVSSEFEELLAAVISEWKEGRGCLGGRSARGLGAFDLIDTKRILRDLRSTAGLLDYLSSDTPWEEVGASDPSWLDNVTATARTRARPNPPAEKDERGNDYFLPVVGSFLSVRVKLQCHGPLIINDVPTAALAGYDFAPRIEQLGKSSRFVLPGSSIRGVLRAQGERIARTVTSHQVVKDHARKDWSARFRECCPACDPQQNNHTDGPLASCQSLVKTYANSDHARETEKKNKDLGFDSEKVPLELFCPACRLFGNTYYGSRLRIEDAFAERQHEVHAQDFLKMDRFTGGGVDSAKFDAVTVWKPEFSMRLHLENPRASELGWLSLILRDLREGLLNFGFGGAKGFGHASFEDATVQIGFIDGQDLDWMLGDGRHALESSSSTCHDSGVYQVKSFDHWDDWAQFVDKAGLVKKWRTSLANFRRREFRLSSRDTESWNPFELKSDSYFGGEQEKEEGKFALSELYPLQPTLAEGEGV